ncbi:AbrB family transcriptional regulator [Phenylobacterium sp.]|uniref:AbrB/MazE/SpoVT family DNA-binding domain-containing protein n=1 Tax=Phenylobacterium sp. TaxID=1871053 RepID=UPI0025D217BD|nr:AbrB family transcriptional regulator [Phenylobacterium sp.]
MAVMATQTTVLSTKGQVILPKAIRERRNWAAGTKLVVEDTDDGVLLRSEPLFKPTTVEEVFGMLKYDGPPISVEEMNAAVLRAAAEDDARIKEDYRRRDCD